MEHRDFALASEPPFFSVKILSLQIYPECDTSIHVKT